MSNFIDQLVLLTDQEMGKSDQLVGDTLSGQGGGTLAFSKLGLGLVVHCLAGLVYQFTYY